MATVSFPNSNLPTTSQPWGREVEKRIVDTAIKVDSNEVNNNARDRQLLAALNRTNVAVANAQTAIDSVISVEEAVYYPGTTEINGGNIRANTIAANKISAGELVGFTIKTAYPNARRVEMSGTDIRFYDEDGNYTGNITGSGVDRASAVEINSSTGSGLFAYNGGADLVGPGTTISAGNSGDGSAKISSNGNIYINLDGTISYARFKGGIIPAGWQTDGQVHIAAGFIRAAGDGSMLGLSRPSSVGTVATFQTGTTTVGTISITASATAYNTSSDYRLKENVVSLAGAIDRLMLLKPSNFNFIAEPDKIVDGFIAHEVADVVPEAVHGEKDGVDEDGEPLYQGIDQSKIVPLLTAAVQELVNRVIILENK